MGVANLNPGDMVFAAVDLINDGSIPGLPEDSPIASAGTRGVILNTGHYEEMPSRTLYLVRFENESNELGPPVGCWEEELTDTPELAGIEAI
jgi:nitrogen fixation protein NifZ